MEHRKNAQCIRVCERCDNLADTQLPIDLTNGDDDGHLLLIALHSITNTQIIVLFSTRCTEKYRAQSCNLEIVDSAIRLKHSHTPNHTQTHSVRASAFACGFMLSVQQCCASTPPIHINDTMPSISIYSYVCILYCTRTCFTTTIVRRMYRHTQPSTIERKEKMMLPRCARRRRGRRQDSVVAIIMCVTPSCTASSRVYQHTHLHKHTLHRINA